MWENIIEYFMKFAFTAVLVYLLLKSLIPVAVNAYFGSKLVLQMAIMQTVTEQQKDTKDGKKGRT